VTIRAEHLNSIPSYRTTEPSKRSRLQQLIDNGAIYVAQTLTTSQFATLQAIAGRIFKPRNPKILAGRLDAALMPSARGTLPSAPPPPVSVDYQLGLDELDTISRTRTSYAFAELPTEIQDAILSLIASRDLTTRKLDLALWLEEFHNKAASGL
jgi:Gluconate 2-dehydrogenase subunit 3